MMWLCVAGGHVTSVKFDYSGQYLAVGGADARVYGVKADWALLSTLADTPQKVCDAVADCCVCICLPGFSHVFVVSKSWPCCHCAAWICSILFSLLVTLHTQCVLSCKLIKQLILVSSDVCNADAYASRQTQCRQSQGV